MSSDRVGELLPHVHLFTAGVYTPGLNIYSAQVRLEPRIKKKKMASAKLLSL